jgi:O-antigen/teichoic acid export membrane protein
MSEIRKKSLKATIWIYVGFVFGAANTYFLAHKNWFTPDQNGLTRALIDISLLIYAFSSFGTTNYLYKFFPYYQDNLEPKKNDLLTTAFSISVIGFALTALGIWALNPLIVKKFGTNSSLLVEYVYWTIPMGFFILTFQLLEAYSYGFGKGVVSSLLKETVIRLYTLIIILLKIADVIDFHSFIILFAFQYAVIVIIMAIYLRKEGKLWISFKTSRVTRKYRKKIIAMLSLTFVVVIVTILRQSIDGLVLAAKQNLGKVGIFGLASYMVSILQAPFRSLVAITIPLLSRAWKEKNLPEIQRIYQRSSINMLGFSLFVYGCILMNFEHGITVFGINPAYLEGKWVFGLLGLVTIIELGTGVNGQIIATSTYWRFELWTSLILTLMIIPLSYWFTVKYGIIGPAMANLISFSIYNFIRFRFLWRKFGLQPFSIKTLELIFIAMIAFSISYFSVQNLTGILAIVSSLLIFTGIYGSLFLWRSISPDVKQLFETLKQRIIKIK